jgi:hypothetical protein
MTNDQIDKDITTLAAAIAAGMTPGLSEKQGDVAQVEIIGAAIGLLGGALKNLNDIARFCRSSTPPGAI